MAPPLPYISIDPSFGRIVHAIGDIQQGNRKEIFMKRLIMLMMLGLFTFAAVGCEIDGKADDDGAKLEVDVDD